MSELATLARPYAAAVFKRAKETGSSEKWSKTLAFLASILSDQTLSVFINNPKVSNERLSGMMLDISEGQIDNERQLFEAACAKPAVEPDFSCREDFRGL